MSHLLKNFIPIAIIIFAICGYLIVKSAITAIILIILSCFSILLIKNERFSLTIIIFLAALGELSRLPAGRQGLPFGPENGLLANDILIPVVIIIWALKKFLLNKNFPTSRITFAFLIFCGIAVISLLNGARHLESVGQFIASSLYLMRFIAYFGLFYLTLDLLKSSEKNRDFILKTLLAAAIFIALAGFLQLIFYPDFSEMASESGWDPHQNRLLSTWFDPNFVGGLFAFMLSIVAALFLYEKSKNTKFRLLIVAAVLTPALFLTYSRSAYLAFAISIFLIGLIRSRQLIVLSLAATILLVSISDRAQERLLGFYNSAKSIIGVGTEVADPTSELRLESWNNSLAIVKETPLLGIGYNTLRYVQHNRGLIEDTAIHHGSGSDSSLLTILMTTGIFGLLSWLWIIGIILQNSYHVWKNNKAPAKDRGLALGLLCGLIGLFAHSFFVNSLLFSPLLVFLWPLAALIKRKENIASR